MKMNYSCSFGFLVCFGSSLVLCLGFAFSFILRQDLVLLPMLSWTQSPCLSLWMLDSGVLHHTQVSPRLISDWDDLGSVAFELHETTTVPDQAFSHATQKEGMLLEICFSSVRTLVHLGYSRLNILTAWYICGGSTRLWIQTGVSTGP